MYNYIYSLLAQLLKKTLTFKKITILLQHICIFWFAEVVLLWPLWWVVTVKEHLMYGTRLL